MTSAVNGTNADRELVNATWQLVYATYFSGIAVAGVGAYIGIRQILMQRRQEEIRTQQLQMQRELERRKRLHELAATIDSEGMIQYKELIYDWYCRLKMQGKPIIFDHTPALRKMTDLVESSFDRVAADAITGSVDTDEFLKRYQVTMLKVWIALEQDIDRKVAGNPNAYLNFRELIEFIKQRNPEMPEIDCSKVDPR
jgi:hypothetical protein